MSFLDILLLALIVAAVGLAVRRMIVNRHRGKSCSGCCEGCTGCERGQVK